MGYNRESRFEDLHMIEVRKALGNLSVKTFFDIETAPLKRDRDEATDLVINLSSGDIAVRVRRRKFFDKGLIYGFDWSIRYDSGNGGKTEIDKINNGFARWYFYGYSEDDCGNLADWYLLDLDKVRDTKILTSNEYYWPIYENHDARKTAGMYVSLRELDKQGCVIYHKHKS